ncbi:MAG TPA: hypothetical protein V6D22_10795 [Candidatus Obscuribacterales bacterium]
MAKKHSFVHDIRVARPCPADWDKMTGDERVRFCGQCKLNVYNISDMTTEEAEQLIIEKEGKLCVRMFRRKDGTLLNQDCPIGRLKKRLILAFGAASAAASLIVVWFMNGRASTCTSQPNVEMGEIKAPIGRPVMGKVLAVPHCGPISPYIMGDVAIPTRHQLGQN